MEFLAIIFFGTLIAISIYKTIYNSTNHKKYEKELLDPNAKVIDVTTKKVGSKGAHVFRTTVKFSDGFQWISHKTDRENHLFSYDIFLTSDMKQEIIDEAIFEHWKTACQKEYEASIKREIDKKKRTEDIFDELMNNRPVKSGQIVCPHCGHVQNSTIKRCLKCSKIIPD